MRSINYLRVVSVTSNYPYILSTSFLLRLFIFSLYLPIVYLFLPAFHTSIIDLHDSCAAKPYAMRIIGCFFCMDPTAIHFLPFHGITSKSRNFRGRSYTRGKQFCAHMKCPGNLCGGHFSLVDMALIQKCMGNFWDIRTVFFVGHELSPHVSHSTLMWPDFCHRKSESQTMKGEPPIKQAAMRQRCIKYLIEWLLSSILFAEYRWLLNRGIRGSPPCVRTHNFSYYVPCCHAYYVLICYTPAHNNRHI